MARTLNKRQKTPTPNINAILAMPHHQKPCRYGAPMGMVNIIDPNHQTLYLQPLRLVDGDYGPDGTYWGSGNPGARMWAAFNLENGAAMPTFANCIYVRARDRAEAMANIQEQYPWAKFKQVSTYEKQRIEDIRAAGGGQ